MKNVGIIKLLILFQRNSELFFILLKEQSSNPAFLMYINLKIKKNISVIFINLI